MLAGVQKYRHAAGLPGLADITDQTRGAFMSQLLKGRLLKETCKDMGEEKLYAEHLLQAIRTSVSMALKNGDAALPEHVTQLLSEVGPIGQATDTARLCVIYDEVIKSTVSPFANGSYPIANHGN